MRKLDRFCLRYDRYGIRNLIAIVMFGNAVVFFANLIGLPVIQYLYFDPALVLRGQLWRVLTFVFIPGSLDLWFIFFLMFYFWIGRMLESQWGCMKFTLFYLSGMFFTLLYGFVSHILYTAQLSLPLTTSIGLGLDANYINLSLFLAAATLFPDMQIRLFLILPIKMKWLGIVYAVLTLLPILIPPYSLLSFTPLVALGNYILFFHPEIARLFRRLTKRGRFKKPYAPKLHVVGTRPADQGDNAGGRGYRHKCTICGTTDLQSPELEFRYCSLCTGAKCYCSRHIFEHEHK